MSVTRLGSRQNPRLTSRLMVLLWVLAVPAIAVVALLWFDRPSEVLMANVIESSVEQSDTAFVGDVTWTDADGTRRVRSVEMSFDHVEAGTVPVVLEPDGQVRVVDPVIETRPSIAALALTALIGLALALVVLATVRGFGYVRGTGRSGEMTSDEVQESHAFYWRH